MKKISLLIIIFLIAGSVYSEDINLWGKLVYEDGYGVKNALVTITNYYTNDVYYDTTDNLGYYSLGTTQHFRVESTTSPIFDSFITNSVGRSCNFYFFDSKQIDIAYVYNILGQRVSKIRLDHELLSSYGIWSNSGFWDGNSTSGHPAASGTYFIVVESAKGIQTLKFHHHNYGKFTTPIPISRIQIERYVENTSFVEEYTPGKTSTESESDLKYFIVEYSNLPEGDQFEEIGPIPHVLFGSEFNSIVDTMTSIIPNDQRILFIGNSYTHNNGVNIYLTGLFESANHDLTIDIQRSTNGGWCLEDHWYYDVTQSKLNDSEWDYVFLQDKSTGPVYNPDRTLRYAQLFDSSIDESGAQTGFYMTWAREWDPDMIIPISTLYTSLGVTMDALVAPVGLAWQKALENDPEIDLYVKDGSHPTVQGTYLAACVFYTTIWHKSPEGIQYGVEFLNSFDERLFLQRIAWETVLEYNRD